MKIHEFSISHEIELRERKIERKLKFMFAGGLLEVCESSSMNPSLTVSISIYKQAAMEFTIVSPKAGTCQCYPCRNKVIYRLQFDESLIGDYLYSRGRNKLREK